MNTHMWLHAHNLPYRHTYTLTYAHTRAVHSYTHTHTHTITNVPTYITRHPNMVHRSLFHSPATTIEVHPIKSKVYYNYAFTSQAILKLGTGYSKITQQYILLMWQLHLFRQCIYWIYALAVSMPHSLLTRNLQDMN